MARPALRKLDVELDLTRHHRVLAELTPPLDLATLFPRRAPLEIEIGSGKGLFLATAAAAAPEHDFLGCELARKYAAHAAARLAKAGLQNACLVQGDALRLFREFLPHETARAVHVYFPDPWWKARHRKRRVLCEPLLRDVERVLQVDGRLHFWTDVQEYFETTLELLRAVTRLAGPLSVAERTAEHDLDYRTHFERRTRLKGAPVYRAEFVKQEAPRSV